MKTGKVVVGTKIFYDPNFCNNRNKLPDPQWRELHEQVAIFINDENNHVVNPEKIRFHQLGMPSQWMMIYEFFVEDDPK